MAILSKCIAARSQLSVGKLERLITIEGIIIPAAVLISLDLFGGPDYLAFLIFLYPLQTLGFQARAWRRYLTCFGAPRFQELSTTMKIDAHRMYRGRVSSDNAEPRRHAFEYALLFVVIALVLGVAARLFSSWTLAWASMYYCIIALKRVVRSARPPTVLFLSASGERASVAAQIFRAIAKPLDVLNLLVFDKEAESLQGFFNFRQHNDYPWEEAVEKLGELARIIIIDITQLTGAIEKELLLAEQWASEKPVYVFSKNPIPGQKVGPFPVVSLREVAERLDTDLQARRLPTVLKEMERQLLEKKNGES